MCVFLLFFMLTDRGKGRLAGIAIKSKYTNICKLWQRLEFDYLCKLNTRSKVAN